MSESSLVYSTTLRFPKSEDDSDKYMPSFKNEAEFNQYFQRENNIVDSYRDKNRELNFKDFDEFSDMLDSLFGVEGYRAFKE